MPIVSGYARRSWAVILLGLVTGVASGGAVLAEPLVPGTGRMLAQVGDDFEDESWSFDTRLPKSSENIDKQQRLPAGEAANDRWYEGVKRGTPDVVRRVETPAGGLPGSEGALLLQSLRTGVPGRPSLRVQQDDFIANVNYRLKGPIPVGRSPSVVVRVFFPPVDQWEDRSGPTFAFRVSCLTHTRKQKQGGGLFASTRSSYEEETYWPGMFVEFQSKTDGGREYDSGFLRVRANGRGGDYKAKEIRQTGWWTLGISCTPDGQVHYFARPGVEDLTAEDHIASEFPYSYRAESLKTFFFNICNNDDGRTWSTAWIIDDARVYVAR